MASSMINGERRWGGTRRGGMTVLGKVAVPKPINLPSQKLENHGLDPNIEIVPKGTLSWGSRPSSSGSNAWGSSGLSPRTDGGDVSPSHLNGRPSSSGGTRPSTAGSEKGHDSTTNTWASSSRPSSASGALTSSHTSLTLLRPRSAETRPGSSQLSRFAGPLAESLGPWKAAGSAEKLGAANSVNDGFSLSSGDFPTLRSDKEGSVKSKDSPDHGTHGRPQSSSIKVSSVTEQTGNLPRALVSDNVSTNAEVKGSGFDTWRKDHPQDDEPRPVMERWHGDPHPYRNPSIPPHHYESWCGAPGVNPPGGVWLRGPTGPPYGAHIRPGGFPMEPFPYFRPQVSPPVLSNPHTVLPQGSGSHGPHPQNGDFYGLPMGDSYIRPAMPIRPGFFPGPVAYEGYYGPPMGFGNPNERDLPFIAMAAVPPVYNRYPNHNSSDPSDVHATSAEARASEQVEFGPHDSRENQKAIIKQNNGQSQNDQEGKQGNKVMANVLSGGQRGSPSSIIKESVWEDDAKANQMMYRERISGEEASAQSFQSSVCPSNVVTGNITPVTVASPKDQALIQKIEGLNAKSRASDGRHDVPSGFLREELHNSVPVVNVTPSYIRNEANTGVVYLERHPTGILVPVSCDMITSVGDKNAEAAVASTRTIFRRSPGAQNEGIHVKNGIHSQDSDGWRKRNVASGSPNMVLLASSDKSLDAQVQDRPIVSQSIEKSKKNVSGRDDTAILGFEPCDSQRAKMREIAKQRAIQLQKEEEERTREQKAKALAKLEELNRRSAYQGKESSNENAANIVAQSVGSDKQENSEKQLDPTLAYDLSVPASTLSSNTVAESSKIASKALESHVPSLSFGTVTEGTIHPDSISVLPQDQPLPAAADVSNDGTAGPTIAPQAREFFRQKRTTYKHKHNPALEKNSAENSILETTADLPKESSTSTGALQVVVNDVASSCQASDSSTSTRKRNSRTSKNKHKPEDSIASVSFLPQNESERVKDVSENVELDPSDNMLDPPPVQSSSDPADATAFTEKNSLRQEDGRREASNSLKKHPRRTHRNTQTNGIEKSHGNDLVVWAPVRSQSKFEAKEDGRNPTAEVAISPGKNEHLMQTSSKSKRAEMERYVPKPVAKELAQQGSAQQSSSLSADQVDADGLIGRASASSHIVDSSGRLGIAAESKNVDRNQLRQTKVQGSWRLRGYKESAPVQAPQDGASTTTNVGLNVTPVELEQTLKPDEGSIRGQLPKPEKLSVKGQPPIIDDGIKVDGWIIYEEPIFNSQARVPAFKDHVTSAKGKQSSTSAKGKQSSMRGHKGGGNNHSFGDKYPDHAEDYPTPVADTPQMERPMSSKENNAMGNRLLPHWQPKSHASAADHHRGNRSCGDAPANVDATMASKETSHYSNLDTPFQQDQDEDVPVTQNERPEARGQRKSASFKGHCDPRSQDSAGLFEPAPPGIVDGHTQQRFSGFHKKGNYNSRLKGVEESNGDSSTNMHETKQQHLVPGNRDQQRQNPNHGYQPITSYNKDKSSNFEGQMEYQYGGPQFRERGRGQLGRGGGNFYRRQRGSARVDSSYE